MSQTSKRESDSEMGKRVLALEKDVGQGMGLSIVYGIIKEHKGDIQYYAETQGSTFVITLPLNAAPNTVPES